MSKTHVDTYRCDWKECTTVFVDEGQSVGDKVAPPGWAWVHVAKVGSDRYGNATCLNVWAHLCPAHATALVERIAEQSPIAAAPPRPDHRIGETYDWRGEPVVFAGLNHHGDAIVHPPGEPDMQSSTVVKLDDLKERGEARRAEGARWALDIHPASPMWRWPGEPKPDIKFRRRG
jgi:hypothetical protein